MFQNELSWYIVGVAVIIAVVAVFLRWRTRGHVNGLAVLAMFLIFNPVAMSLADGGISRWMAGSVVGGELLLVFSLTRGQRAKE